MIIQNKFQIIENFEIAEDFFLLQVRAPQIAKQSLPGQFVSILIEERNLLLRRPFSVFDCDKNSLKIIYKVVGKATRALTSLKKGAYADILGPLGKGFEIGRVKRHLIVGGGVGIAPLYSLAKKIGRPKDAAVLLGAKTKKELICEKDFKKLGCDTFVATEDGSKGEKGFVSLLLERELENGGGEAVIYSCGPKGMLKAVSEIAARHNVKCQLSLEEYMACGVGTCMGCVVKISAGEDFEYQRVCKEGPVFDSEMIVWE